MDVEILFAIAIVWLMLRQSLVVAPWYNDNPVAAKIMAKIWDGQFTEPFKQIQVEEILPRDQHKFSTMYTLIGEKNRQFQKFPKDSEVT